MTPMDCAEAREGLWPPEEPRLARDRVVEAREHVDRCPACQEYFRQDRLILDAYDRIRQKGAPRAVRERVFDVLAQERARTMTEIPQPRRWAGWWVAGISALVLALGTGLWAGLSPDPPEGEVFVEDYLRRAVADDRIATSSVERVTRFLERELGLFDPPLFQEGLRLTGVEICLLEGRRGAMITYETEGRTVSHYLVPRKEALARPPTLAGRLHGADSNRSSPAVITWASPSLEQALVGSLPPDRLLTLARRARSASGHE